MEKLFLDAFDGEKIPVTFFPCDNPKGLFKLFMGLWSISKDIMIFVNS